MKKVNSPKGFKGEYGLLQTVALAGMAVMIGAARYNPLISVMIDSLFFVIADCCISLIFVPELLIKVNLNPVSAFCTIIVRVHADHCV